MLQTHYHTGLFLFSIKLLLEYHSTFSCLSTQCFIKNTPPPKKKKKYQRYMSKKGIHFKIINILHFISTNNFNWKQILKSLNWQWNEKYKIIALESTFAMYSYIFLLVHHYEVVRQSVKATKSSVKHSPATCSIKLFTWENSGCFCQSFVLYIKVNGRIKTNQSFWVLPKFSKVKGFMQQAPGELNSFLRGLWGPSPWPFFCRTLWTILCQATFWISFSRVFLIFWHQVYENWLYCHWVMWRIVTSSHFENGEFQSFVYKTYGKVNLVICLHYNQNLFFEDLLIN